MGMGGGPAEEPGLPFHEAVCFFYWRAQAEMIDRRAHKQKG